MAKTITVALFGIMLFLSPTFARAHSSFEADPEYPTSSRIQISESCANVAKWITQSLTSGPHWELVGYQPDLGLLKFKVISMGKLNRAESREYLAAEDSRAKNVHAALLEFTLRSLVSSTLSFDGGQQQSTGGSCAVAAAFKFVDKNGTAVSSSGKMEMQLLDRLRTRYAEHGLDY
jgi:hypothetical protein